MSKLFRILSLFLSLSLVSAPFASASGVWQESTPGRKTAEQKPRSKFFNYSSSSDDSSLSAGEDYPEESSRKTTSPKRAYSDEHSDEFSPWGSFLASPTKRPTLESAQNSPSDSDDGTVRFLYSPNSYQEKKRVIEERKQTRVLFVGVNTGVPELDFLNSYFEGHTYAPKEIELSVYDPVKNRPLSEAGSYLIDSKGVDVNLLDSPKYEARGFQKNHYELIIWIGPTFDESVAETPRLVEQFVKRARLLLHDEGRIFVVQNILAKNFSNISEIDGAEIMDRTVLLSGRETHRGKLLPEDRKDHVIRFHKW